MGWIFGTVADLREEWNHVFECWASMLNFPFENWVNQDFIFAAIAVVLIEGSPTPGASAKSTGKKIALVIPVIGISCLVIGKPTLFGCALRVLWSAILQALIGLKLLDIG
jgi:hypothetical protein